VVYATTDFAIFSRRFRCADGIFARLRDAAFTPLMPPLSPAVAAALA